MFPSQVRESRTSMAGQSPWWYQPMRRCSSGTRKFSRLKQSATLRARKLTPDGRSKMNRGQTIKTISDGTFDHWEGISRGCKEGMFPQPAPEILMCVDVFSPQAAASAASSRGGSFQAGSDCGVALTLKALCVAFERNVVMANAI